MMTEHLRPMRILIVNPNTTPSMTEKVGGAARRVASPATEITAVNPSMGPASIEGYYDEAFSVPGLLEEIRRGEAAGYDGYVIACFDDTGLDAARALAAVPVVGICEAAMHVAPMLGGRFSVVTTLARSVPALQVPGAPLRGRRPLPGSRRRRAGAGARGSGFQRRASGGRGDRARRPRRWRRVHRARLRRHGRSGHRPHQAARACR